MEQRQTKVVLKYQGGPHWIYMVYVLSIENIWNAVQYFRPNEREHAIQYAKDIARSKLEEMDVVIFTCNEN
jgi:hypothetical protein